MSLAALRVSRSSARLVHSPLRASLDRYSTIRAFFCRQSNISRVTSAHISFPVHVRHSARGIHSTTLLLLQNGKEPVRNNDSTLAKDHESTDAPRPPPPPEPPHPPNLDNYSDFYRRLALSVPHLHRPTRDDFLKVTSGFWERLRVRFKWFTIKSFRRFNADDISAFITWFVMSQTLWILVGTTTFFSFVFATANSLRLQQYIARAISDYLTSETGVTIIFESAIVPKWKDSKISFKNVYISRRPNTLPSSIPLVKRKSAHTAALGYDISSHPANHHMDDEDDEAAARDLIAAEEDFNYSMFDLTVDSIDVTLSLFRWLDGRGLVENAIVRGVRGVLDRRNVEWDLDLQPALFRHPATPGSFELDSLGLEDVLITVYQPDDFRPYTASIFKADIRTFRKQWLFYDFLCAENIVGQFDGCLFSLHKPQSIGRTRQMDLEDSEFTRMSRIRIDGVSVDHLQGGSSNEGPISWITSGKVDAVLDIKFPRDPTQVSFPELLGEIAESITSSLGGEPDPEIARIPGQRALARPALTAPEDESTSRRVRIYDDGSEIEIEETPKVVIDIDLRFRDVKAAVPIFTQDLSYVNNALIRPIVAFVNANRTLIPIHCRVTKDLSDFDGSWTMWETGLMDEISLKVYDALAYHVTETNMNKRIKTVGAWSLQMTASLVLTALRNTVDPVAAQLRQAVHAGYEALQADTTLLGA